MLEEVGKEFNYRDYFSTRLKTCEAVQKVSKLIRPGMREEEGIEIINSVLAKMGAEKNWHPHKIRFGQNTLKSFREESLDIKLGENDIFFIDIGPVFNGYEGDYGETFVVGNNPEHLKIKEDVVVIFKKVAREWDNGGVSGKELYQRAENIAQSMGYLLSAKMNGHRLGEFPHGLYYKGALQDVEKVTNPRLWVLEILISHPLKSFGAFYEDILVPKMLI